MSRSRGTAVAAAASGWSAAPAPRRARRARGGQAASAAGLGSGPSHRAVGRDIWNPVHLVYGGTYRYVPVRTSMYAYIVRTGTYFW